MCWCCVSCCCEETGDGTGDSRFMFGLSDCCGDPGDGTGHSRLMFGLSDTGLSLLTFGFSDSFYGDA